MVRSWAWVRVPVPDRGLLAWFTFPAGATGEGSRGFLPASIALALLNIQGNPVEKTGCKLPWHLHLPGFFTFVLSVLDLQHLSRALSSSHVLPQARQCMHAVSFRRHLSFLRFQAGWLPCNCGFLRDQEFVYYSEFSVSMEQHSFQLSPLQQKLEGCVILGGPTSSGLPSQIGPRKLPAADLACPSPMPILSRGVL